MLAHPTLDQLHALGLHGLAKGYKELEHKPDARGLDHAEWLGLLLEYELTLRRVDAGSVSPLGRQDRAEHRRLDQRRARQPAAS